MKIYGAPFPSLVSRELSDLDIIFDHHHMAPLNIISTLRIAIFAWVAQHAGSDVLLLLQLAHPSSRSWTKAVMADLKQ